MAVVTSESLGTGQQPNTLTTGGLVFAVTTQNALFSGGFGSGRSRNLEVGSYHGGYPSFDRLTISQDGGGLFRFDSAYFGDSGVRSNGTVDGQRVTITGRRGRCGVLGVCRPVHGRPSRRRRLHGRGQHGWARRCGHPDRHRGAALPGRHGGPPDHGHELDHVVHRPAGPLGVGARREHGRNGRRRGPGPGQQGDWYSRQSVSDAQGRLDWIWTKYDHGILALGDLDQADAAPWYSMQSVYDAQGRLDWTWSKNDRGTVVIDDLDQANAGAWSSVRTVLDAAGRLDWTWTANDDGSSRFDEHDQAGSFDWASIAYLRDTSNQLVQTITTYDNGSILVA